MSERIASHAIAGRVWLLAALGVLMLLAAGGIAPVAHGQDISVLPGQWVTFDRNHGLPGDDVHAVWGAPDGNTIWAGTAAGLARFDGVAWQPAQGDAPALHDMVRAIWGRSAQDLWVAGDAGLAHFDGQGWRQVPSAETGLSKGRLYALWGSDAGDLWVGGEQGAAHYNGAAWRTFTPEKLPFQSADVRAFTGSKDGRTVWIGTISGLARYEAATETWVKPQIADLDLAQTSPFRQNRVRAYGLGEPWADALLLTDEALWVGMPDGLLRHDLRTGKWALLDGSQWDGPDGVTNIWSDGGDLWLAVSVPDFMAADPDYMQILKTRSPGGIRRLHDQNWLAYGTGDGLGSEQVRSIWSDGRGAFWFATGYGLSRFDAERWRFFTPTSPAAQPVTMVRGNTEGDVWFVGPNAYLWQDGRWAPTVPVEPAITRVWVGSRDEVWAATPPAGLSLWDGHKWNSFSSPWTFTMINAMWRDAPGSVWLGTSQGLSHFDLAAQRWELLTAADSPLPSNLITALWASNGEVWAGTYDGGVVHYTPAAQRMEIYTKIGLEDRTGPLDLVGNNVRSLAVDKAGNLWAATSGGVARYNRADGTWRQWRAADILPQSDEPHAIAVASDGTAWLSAEREGVYKYSPESDGWEHFAPDRLTDGDLSIWIDSADRAWFGGNGARRLDPRTGEWLTFSVRDGLVSDDVRAIWGDAAGTLWFATRLGVSRLSDGRWQTFTGDNGLRDSNATLLVGDDAGNVWAATLPGVNHYANGAWQEAFSWPGAGMLGRDLYAPGGGRLWVASPEGALYYYNGSAWTEVQVTGAEKIGPIQAVVEDAGGNLWIGGEKGLAYRLAGQATWATITTDKPADFRINAMWGDGQDFVWVGTADGISRYDVAGGSWQHFRTSEGLLSNTVGDLWGDEDGHLWAAHDGGVSAFDGTAWRALPADGLPSRKVNSVWGDASGQLWAGTDAGPAQWNGVHWQPADTGQGRFSGRVLDMWSADDGLWIGTTNEVLRVNGDDWQTWAPDSSIPADGYAAVWSDGHGTALAGGRTLARFDGAHWQIIPWRDVLGESWQGNSPTVRDIWGASANDIYVTTTSAIAHFDGTRWSLFHDKDATKVIGDGKGGLWVLGWGTLYHVANGQWQRVTNPDLSSVRAIWHTPDNSLWLSTAEASYKMATPDSPLSPAGPAVRALATDASGTLWYADEGYTLHRWDRYSSDRSLSPPLLSVGGRDAALADNILQEDKNGDIWFRTPDGLGRYRPRQPMAAIESITMADGRPATRSEQEIVLPYRPAKVSISLIATDTTSLAEDMIYWYRLEGWDSGWKSNQGAAGIDKRSQIAYVGLKEGSYTLQIVVNNANADSTGVQEWPLTVEPIPWYVTFRESPAFWWVLAALGLLLVGAGGGGVRILQARRAYGYRDAELVVRKGDERTYDVTWLRPRQTSVVYQTRLEPLATNVYCEALESDSASEVQLRQLGQILFDGLFNDNARRLLLQSAPIGRKGWRLRINLASVPELWPYPWEFTYGGSRLGFLGINPNTAVARYLPPEAPAGRSKTSWPLEVLVVWAEPQGASRVSAEMEVEAIQAVLQPLVDRKQLHLTCIPHATISTFRQAVDEGADIVHFIGHGDVEGEQGVLYLEDGLPRRGSIALKQEELAAMFRGSVQATRTATKTPGLVVLNACRSGAAQPDAAAQPGGVKVAGLALTLLRNTQVPAVVAMQYEVDAQVAARFAEHFYRALVSHGGGQVDYAISVARHALYPEEGAVRRDWGTPVLYMQVTDGRVFELVSRRTRKS